MNKPIDHNTDAQKLNSPVIIGGVGGSGTRVLSEIVSALGWHLGKPDSNESLDYTGFTVLFKNPKFRRPGSRKRNLKAFRLLEKSLRGQPRLNLSNLYLALSAGISMSFTGHNHLGEDKGTWPLLRAKRLFFSNRTTKDPSAPWGWKEPNSHIYLDQFSEAFPNFRYLHLMRHGVDMAFSGNQQQMMKWGYFFDIPKVVDEKDVPRLSLQYWAAANLRAVRLGKELGERHFLAVKFEELCQDAANVIPKIAKFLGRDIDDRLQGEIEKIPQLPSSSGRHRDQDLQQFRAEDLEVVRQLGFEIESSDA